MPTRRKAAGAKKAPVAKRGGRASLRSRPASRHDRRLIAVDVGNSETVVGLLHQRAVLKYWRLPPD